MKFLHLADLHIGKNVNGFSMIEEQKYVFKQIIGYIGSECPQAVIIAGDVYDRALPSVEAVRLFDDFLTELAQQNVVVLLVSGNHDSPERLNYASRLLAEKSLYICGAYNGVIDKIVLDDDYGQVNFFLLPFIKPFTVRSLGEGNEIESYSDALEAALHKANIDYSGRNVLVSHQFYSKAGLLPLRSESELNQVGGLDAVSVELIEDFDYVALGHLHGRQSVGKEYIRYAGSPLKYSFSEWRQEKSIYLVELKDKGDFTVNALPLIPIHDMREIRGEFNKLINEESADQAYNEDYLRVILTDEEEIIDPLGKLSSMYPHIMSLSFENSRSAIDLDSISTEAENIEKLSCYDLFGEFFLDVQGCAMNEEQAEIIRELLSMEGML
ncbi:MAG: exonuclease SbcCD subunit D [Firmicutes bacterium]|nr:exonuclease SbcCD subunit D [Bacillota bacterium]